MNLKESFTKHNTSAVGEHMRTLTAGTEGAVRGIVLAAGLNRQPVDVVVEPGRGGSCNVCPTEEKKNRDIPKRECLDLVRESLSDAYVSG